MASRRGKEDIASLDVQSYVRGYHAYQDIWDPIIGEVLPLEREPIDSLLPSKEEATVVGHLPFNLAPVVCQPFFEEVSTRDWLK